MQIEATDDGKLKISIWELLSSLSEEAVNGVIDALACRDSVIEEVANQIIGGWTSEGSHGAKGCVESVPTTVLDSAVRRVAEASGELAKSEIRQLTEKLGRLEGEHRRVREWGWQLYHEWRDRLGIEPAPPPRVDLSGEQLESLYLENRETGDVISLSYADGFSIVVELRHRANASVTERFRAFLQGVAGPRAKVAIRGAAEVLLTEVDQSQSSPGAPVITSAKLVANAEVAESEES